MYSKKSLLLLSDSQLNHTVRIQGTKFDRKRKVSDKTDARMKELYNSGMPVMDIAKLFDLSYNTVKYHVDEEYNKYCRSRKNAHTGKTHISVQDRIEYKRKLVRAGAKVII